MYVCICNAVTENTIRQAAAEGVRSMGELTRRTGCSGDCGSCADLAEKILRESQPRRMALFSLPMVAQAA